MDQNKVVFGEALSIEKFMNPSKEFGIMPFWFWNGELEEDELIYQLKEFKDKGIPGIIIHSRFGIKDSVGYMTEKWLEKTKFTIKKAKEMGLGVWVYDEYNWPSGTADHEVMKEDPDLTQRYLEVSVTDLPGQYFTFLEGTDSRYVDLEQSEPVYACAILEEDMKKGNFEYIDLMPSLSFDKVITWEAPKGPWKLFYFIERQASWYSDVLNEETTKKFIELTHEKYKETLGGTFEGKVGGFYTDEPAMHYFEVTKDNYIIPWSKNMFKIFYDANGYDLKPHLPKLFYDISEDTAQVRYDFWSALTKQYEKAYYVQLRDWCRENDVLFTGHLLFEEYLRIHARCGGNLFNCLKHMDITGVDHLYPRIGSPEMPEEHVSLKIASSAAHQFGSARLLCESMGGIFWDVTMERMKLISDWEYVLGVNLLNPHGFHYSIEGERKRDWPPSQFYHHTWWEQYKLYNEYVTRKGYILSGGRHVAKIAILYPMNSMWTNYTPQERNEVDKAIEFDFNYLTDTLLRFHTDFDYIDEDVMREHGTIKDGKLCIKDEEYSLLILPPVTHIKEDTVKMMEEFYASGGNIIGETLLPIACVEGSSEGLSDRMKAMFGVEPKEIKATFDKGQLEDFEMMANTNGRSKAIFLKGPGLYKTKPKELLREAILNCITPEIEIDNEDVLYLHRVKDGRDFYFIINPVETGKKINIKIQAEGRPEIWNLENGEIEPINVYTEQDGFISFDYQIYPYGSVMVSFGEQSPNCHIEDSNLKINCICEDEVEGYGRISEEAYINLNMAGEIERLAMPGVKPVDDIVFDSNWDFKTNLPNMMLINHWKVAIDENQIGLEEGYHKPAYDDSDWMDFGMGAWEMQLSYERGKQTYPVTLWYRTQFEADFIPEDLKMMIDGFKGKEYQLFINGQEIIEEQVRSYLDAEIKEVGINRYVEKGINNIVVRIVVDKKTGGILDLLKITGSFILNKKDDKYILVEGKDTPISTGNWVDAGYPYFSGTGTFIQTVNIEKDYLDNRIIKINLDCGTDIVEVYVNGKYAGIRMWHPYELDVTEYLKAGENRFEFKVINTLVNALQGVEQASGIFSAKLTAYDIYRFEK